MACRTSKFGLIICALVFGLVPLAGFAVPESAFVNFENAPIHPVDLSPDGQTLCVVNLADYRLEVFDLAGGTPVPAGSVPVGVDPVAVRFRTDSEVWVVNHVSDSVSIVDLSSMSIVTTLLTDDEPCDVVFAGAPERAFVSCSQANKVQVFDPLALDAPPTEIPIDAEDPRSLAVSSDGTKVYAAIFESGNNSTILGGGSEGPGVISFPPNVVNDGAGPYGGTNPPPNDGGGFSPAINPAPTPPPVGLIVKRDDAGNWLDDNGGDWTDLVSGTNAALSGRPVGWNLPDRDIATIDVAAATVIAYATGLMNICMSLAVNPADDRVTMVGTDGKNEIRFEPNITGTFLRVQFAASNAAGTIKGVTDLNAHLIPYSASQVVMSERVKSIGDPRGMVWNAAGTKAYVTGMGSNNMIVVGPNGQRIGVAPTIELGEGPTGLALDEPRNRIYVLNRFEGSLSVVSVTSETEIARVPLFDPTPMSIKVGRKHLYGTHETSGLGHVACAACHIDSRMDRLAWDLGDPSGGMKSVNGTEHNRFPDPSGFEDFHPMKGPMTTQTLQDIIGHEPLHWRGDRNGLEQFNPAFVGLQGSEAELSPMAMQEFENFLDTISFGPNPHRKFDNTLPANLPLPGHFTTGRFAAAGAPLPDGDAQRGLTLYRDTVTRLDGSFACVTCHTLPTGMGTDLRVLGSGPPFFQNIPLGPMGETHHAIVSVDGSTNKAIKIPQLRNQFEKTGFNMTQVSNSAGFGFLHDGSVDSLERFFTENAFSVTSDQDVADLVALTLAFSGSELPSGDINNQLDPPGPPSQDSHAAVGAQVTIDGATPIQRIADMIAVAVGGRADLVARGGFGGPHRGAYYDTGSGMFVTDRDSDPSLTPDALRAFAAPGNELTYTLVPPGTGVRVGTDRDLDTYGDRTEIEVGSNPADESSTPANIPPTPEPPLNVEGWSLYD